jgi:2-amino-4-hydroxy-6-hydroxymethyldihydropteridine diphosphokinase
VIIIGIGANVPASDGTPALATARRAALQLGNLPGMRLHALSRWFLTDPVPPSAQPPYVNAVAVLAVQPSDAAPDPAVLLRRLQAIEAGAGRVRGERNAPRPLDLDIIAMGEAGGMVRQAPDPILPHPRAHLRAFVLLPLLDVAPWWIHPVLRRSAADLLRDLPPQGVQAISSAAPSDVASSDNY